MSAYLCFLPRDIAQKNIHWNKKEWSKQIHKDMVVEKSIHSLIVGYSVIISTFYANDKRQRVYYCLRFLKPNMGGYEL